MQSWESQSLLGVAFFEATAQLILLTLFVLFQRDHRTSFLRYWLGGWTLLTGSTLAELAIVLRLAPGLRLAYLGCRLAAVMLFLAAVVEYNSHGRKKLGQLVPLTIVCVGALLYLDRGAFAPYGTIRWETALFESCVFLSAGWMLWRGDQRRRGHGTRLLAGALMLCGLHGLDRPVWLEYPLFSLRVAFDHLLVVAIGIATVVVVLEEARARTEELNDKLRRLTLITTASTQLLNVNEVLDEVLSHLVESLGATHGLVRLLEGHGDTAELVLRASVGFSPAFRSKYARVSIRESWAQKVLKQGRSFLSLEDEPDTKLRERMMSDGLSGIVIVRLPGADGPLGILAVGSSRHLNFQADETNYLVNIANLLSLTIQNVRLFEQVSTVQRQWEYTFDSIGDPVIVHDREFRVLRANQRLGHLLGREPQGLLNRKIGEILPPQNGNWHNCPYCEGAAGEGDDPDPWLKGYFLASNSTFSDPAGRQLGTVHVLKDITERKRAEEKYRTLVANVQEGVFISTPQGRFLDFNEAFLRMTGFETREELMAADIPTALYVHTSERERLKKLLHEHGSVADFEFLMRRKDGEIRTMLESSIAVRDANGNVTAYQGFVLDISERKQAEHEIRRRNRELMVLNSIGQTMSESLDLSDLLHRALRQISELFGLELGSVFLLDEAKGSLRRVAAVGHRSEYARSFPATSIQPELLRHIRSVRATILAAQGLPLPGAFRDLQHKEGLRVAHVVILWSKDRMIGCLVVGSRTVREFSPAELNLLAAVGTQISNAIERSLLYEETRQAYENLRKTQEQLLQSEKMAAVGQLISGVAHELNNPLTAILGYSQLLTSSGQVGPQGIEYVEKLYKQAQRTHRIVQNLLSFARQHKPERLPVHVNQIVEDTLALRDYDLRINNIRVLLDLDPHLPMIAADAHQLQQVFLNIVNNAVDAILERSDRGEILVRTRLEGERLIIEFTDSGPGVLDPSRVFDPFYTTKPVGKGTGLGLSICYGIVTEHGGTIRVRNEPVRGATFAIELPCQRAESASTVSPPELHEALPGARILLVDDEESVLELEQEVLQGRGHLVRMARDGEDVRRLLTTDKFDLLILDLNLAGGASGLQLYAWIRENHPALSLRVLFTTSEALGPDKNQMAGGTGCPVLQKPFLVPDFLAAVEARLHQTDPAAV
jgi:two-component system NtrC family sensor kinase